MKSWIRWTLTSLTVMAAGTVQAGTTFIDYQWKFSPDACLIRAAAAMKSAGFKRSGSTDSSTEVVGVKGDYKGVVACVGEASDLAIFIVAGPNYEQAKTLSMKMKNNF